MTVYCVRSSFRLLKLLSLRSFSLLLYVDEKAKPYPPYAPPNAGGEGAPPSYGAEMGQPAGIVYVQAPRQVRNMLLVSIGSEGLAYCVVK